MKNNRELLTMVALALVLVAGPLTSSGKALESPQGISQMAESRSETTAAVAALTTHTDID